MTQFSKCERELSALHYIQICFLAVSLSHDLLKNDCDPLPVSNNASICSCTFFIRLHRATLILMNNCCLNKVLTTYLFRTISNKVLSETRYYTCYVFPISDKSLKLFSLLMTGIIRWGKKLQTKPNAHNHCFIHIQNYNQKNCKINFRFDHYVQNIDISDSVVLSLDKTSLRDLGVISLVQLNASRNYISDIHEEAFLGQSKLQRVDLSSNSLMNIEPKTFIRNSSLEILSLSSNQYEGVLISPQPDQEEKKATATKLGMYPTYFP